MFVYVCVCVLSCQFFRIKNWVKKVLRHAHTYPLTHTLPEFRFSVIYSNKESNKQCLKTDFSFIQSVGRLSFIHSFIECLVRICSKVRWVNKTKRKNNFFCGPTICLNRQFMQSCGGLVGDFSFSSDKFHKQNGDKANLFSRHTHTHMGVCLGRDLDCEQKGSRKRKKFVQTSDKRAIAGRRYLLFFAFGVDFVRTFRAGQHLLPNLRRLSIEKSQTKQLISFSFSHSCTPVSKRCSFLFPCPARVSISSAKRADFFIF